MKRFACLAALLPLLLAPAFAQVVFHDDFQVATLNRFLAGDLDSSWTLYNDGNKPSSSIKYFDEAWKIVRLSDGEMVAASPSLFSGNKAADRWMVSPAINLSEVQNPVLRFRSKALEANNRDGFEVRISTDSTEKEDFKTTLKSVSRSRNEWEYYSIDLSEYKGQNIYIAFVQNSKGKYIIAIDDIVVYDKGEINVFLDGFSLPFTKITDSNQAFVDGSAVLYNGGSQTITSYKLCSQTDNDTVRKIEVSGIEVNADDTLFLSARFALEKPGYHTFTLWLEDINGQAVSSPKTSTLVYSAHNKELPKKNTLLEIFSSGMCTACAPWNRVLHGLFVSDHANVADNHGNFCVVKYQVNIPAVGDPCVTEQSLGRGSFYNVNAAPTLYLNGSFLPLSNETTLQTIRKSIHATKKTTVPTGITAYLEREDYTFKVHAEITGYLPDPNDYRLLICLIEDSIHHTISMHNGETDFYYVTRYMMTGTEGLEIDACGIGETITKDFEYTFDQSSPRVFSSLENINAVIFLQDKNNRDIVQARYLWQGYKDSSIIVKDSSIINDSSIIVNNCRPERLQQQLYVYPNPASEYCRIDFTAPANTQARLELIDRLGKSVSSRNITLQAGENQFELNLQHLTAGLYFVRITSPQGMFVHKLMKR